MTVSNDMSSGQKVDFIFFSRSEAKWREVGATATVRRARHPLPFAHLYRSSSGAKVEDAASDELEPSDKVCATF